MEMLNVGNEKENEKLVHPSNISGSLRTLVLLKIRIPKCTIRGMVRIQNKIRNTTHTLSSYNNNNLLYIYDIEMRVLLTSPFRCKN